jgi:hypothetical protein
VFGSYDALAAGNVYEALTLLTGMPSETMNLQPLSRWSASKSQDADSLEKRDLLWAQLLSFRDVRNPIQFHSIASAKY